MATLLTTFQCFERSLLFGFLYTRYANGIGTMIISSPQPPQLTNKQTPKKKNSQRLPVYASNSLSILFSIWLVCCHCSMAFGYLKHIQHNTTKTCAPRTITHPLRPKPTEWNNFEYRIKQNQFSSRCCYTSKY